MSKIKLKQKSPEFDEGKPKATIHACEIAGCRESGEFRAPKDRSLAEYYRFCKAHVADYNRAWNFFDGMNDKDIQDHMYESLFGNRPTWKFTGNIDMEDELRRQAGDFYGDAAKAREKKKEEKRNRQIATATPEGAAMEIMGLSAPITLDEIKFAYKALAKKWHPDVNKNDPEAEEKLKDINMAYTVLRLAYQKFEDAAERF